MDLEMRSDVLATGETVWKAPYDYKGGHYDHFLTFFNAIRGQGTIVQDPSFGLRAGGAALLANSNLSNEKRAHQHPFCFINNNLIKS